MCCVLGEVSCVESRGQQVVDVNPSLLISKHRL